MIADDGDEPLITMIATPDDGTNLRKINQETRKCLFVAKIQNTHRSHYTKPQLTSYVTISGYQKMEKHVKESSPDCHS